MFMTVTKIHPHTMAMGPPYSHVYEKVLCCDSDVQG